MLFKGRDLGAGRQYRAQVDAQQMTPVDFPLNIRIVGIDRHPVNKDRLDAILHADGSRSLELADSRLCDAPPGHLTILTRYCCCRRQRCKMGVGKTFKANEEAR